MYSHLQFFLVVTLVSGSLLWTQVSCGASKPMRILALFSGTKNDLGIDHRLGRQVLKLARNKAKQLYPNLGDIELVVYNDDTDCTNLNKLPARVAEYYYGVEGNKGSCNENATSGCNQDKDLDSYLQDLEKQDKVRKRRLSGLVAGTGEDSSRVDAIIGPSCDLLVDLIARMAAYWQTPIYSVTSVGVSFSRKDVYSTLTRLSPSIDQLSLFVLDIMKKFNWRNMAILVDTIQVENLILLQSLEKAVSKERHVIPIEKQVFKFNSQTLTSSSNDSSSSSCSIELRETLLGAKRVARVFMLLLTDQQLVRRLLLCAHELHMNDGEFTFMVADLGIKTVRTQEAILEASKSTAEIATKMKSTSQRALQNYDWYVMGDEENNLLARQMFESLMVLSVELPIGDEYSLFVEQALDLVHNEFPEVVFDRSSVGSLAVALHDSLLIAVEAYMRFQENKHADMKLYTSSLSYNLTGFTMEDFEMEERKTKKIALFWNESFSNGLITSIHINPNGDQELSYVLSDMEPETGSIRPVASFSKEKRQIEMLPNSYIHWPRRLDSKTKGYANYDEPPPNEPECGFNDDADRCIDRQNLYAALTIVAILIVLVVATTSVSLYKYRQIKYQMKLEGYWWKIEWSDLQFIQYTESLSSKPQSVARAITSGAGSVISQGSDGGSSFLVVSKSHPNEVRRNVISNPNEVREETKSIKETTRRSKRKSVVPLIITSTEDSEGKSIASTSKRRRNNDDAMSQSGIASSKPGSGLNESCVIRSEYSSVVRASNLAMYKTELVIVKQLNATVLEMSRELLVELQSMREHINENLAKFIGLCVEPNRLSIVYEYCSRGSLKDMLMNPGVAMDWTLKYSIIGDILNGLNFIHTTLLDYHGRLKSTNLVIDSRFTIKITDFGLQNLYSQLEPISDRTEGDEEDEEERDDGAATNSNRIQPDRLSLSVSQAAYNMESVSVRGAQSFRSTSERRMLKNRGAARLFWTAPEHLRDKNVHFVGSKKGDVYSLAIIFFELFTRKEPYHYGTNAKPYWPAIKRDRNALRRQTQHLTADGLVSEAFPNIRKLSMNEKRLSIGRQVNHSGFGSDSSVGGSFVGSVGKQARRARNKLKISGASVSPSQQQSNMEKTETGSVSNQSISSSQNSPAMQDTSRTAESTTGLPGSIRLSVAAIGEEDDIGKEEDAEKFSEIGSSGKKTVDPDEVVDQLRMGIQPEPVRPYVPNYVIQEVDHRLIELMKSCWNESPVARPAMSQVRTQLRRITKGVASKNYLDNLLERLQNYAADLERIVDSKSSDIVAEKSRTEELLYQLVPKFVADRLKRNEPIIPQVFDGVTVFFSDIVGFEKYASVMSPTELVDLLNNIYSSFDSIISSFDVTKIETIIDQFLVASGISFNQDDNSIEQTAATAELKEQQSVDEKTSKMVSNAESKSKKKRILDTLLRGNSDGKKPIENNSLEAGDNGLDTQSNVVENPEVAPQSQKRLDTSHYRRSSAEQIARMALCIRDLVKSFHFRQNLAGSSEFTETKPSSNLVATSFNIRIGIHSGNVCAGIVGVKRPKFCLIGDTVNVASRMHTNSKANKIQISVDTKQLLEQIPGFNIEPRGKIEVKGKGMMETFWLESSY